MNDLIKIQEKDGKQVVSARELHEFLEIKSKFADWIKNRIKEYDFSENQDFITISKILENGGKSTDYALTLDMAKELSMVERNDKGKAARQYFIEAEKALQSQPLSLSQQLLKTAELLVNHEDRIKELERNYEHTEWVISVPKYCREFKKDFSTSQIAEIQQIALQISKEKGVYCTHNIIGEVENYLFGREIIAYAIIQFTHTN